MEDTIGSVFLAGRERFARLRQVGALVVCAVVFVHLTLFLGYTRTVFDAEAAKVDLARSVAAAGATADVHESLAAFGATLTPATMPILDRLLANLRGDFIELGNTVTAIRGGTAAPRDRQPRQDVRQGPIPSKRSPVQARLDEKAAQDRIRAVRTHDEYRAALDPIIAEAIVAKRFDEANREWADHVTSAVRPAAIAVNQAIARAAPGGQTTDARWTQLATAVAKTEAAAAELRFKPPESGGWWRSVDGKTDAIETLAHQAADALVVSTSAALLSDDLAKSAEASSRDAQALAAELDTRRRNVEDQAKDAVESLSSFAKPLEAIAVDVKWLVRWFPLIVGATLAFALYLGTEGRRSYLEALDFTTLAAPEDPAWTRVVAQSRTSLARGSSPWIPWLVAAALWIGAASWRLASLQITSVSRAVTVGAVGLALVAAGVAHRVFTVGRR